MNYEEVYNTYLAVSRGSRGKPWKARKDFSNFAETSDGVYCRKLELFFKKFPQINIREFFSAPYIVYKDEDHFPLQFYNTQKAIAVYTTLIKQKLEESPDSDSHLEDIKKSLKYIALFCLTSKITLEEYCRKNAGYTTQPFIDFHEKKVNIYVLISLPFFAETLNIFCNQDKQIYLKDLCDNVGKFKTRLHTSSKAKTLIANGLNLINKNTNN
jgi:hypothetical protein